MYRPILIGIVISFALATQVSAEFYKYVDEQGNITFTDNLSNIPEDRNPSIKTLGERQEVPKKTDSHSFKIDIPKMVYDKWSSVRFSVVDKINGEKREYDVSIGDSLVIPDSDLKVFVKNFVPEFVLNTDTISSRSNDPNNPAANIIIYERSAEIFKGWLYSRFPTIHPFEHPRYEINLVGGITK